MLEWLADDAAVLAYLELPDRRAPFAINQQMIDVDAALARLHRSIA